MNSYATLRHWMDAHNFKTHATIGFAVMVVLSMVVFGIAPHGTLDVLNAGLSGGVWALGLCILILGGKRVDFMSTTGVALIVGGLTTSIPSLFYEHSPVDWGSSLSRLGFLILFTRWVYELMRRWKVENGEAV